MNKDKQCFIRNEDCHEMSDKARSDMPLVTIIIPAYNHEKYVEQALLSAINQTYENIEVIVIDDGSSDTTPLLIERIINSCSRGRDIIFIRQENQGLSKTLNKAINLANGSFVQFLASDDAYLPEKTTKCLAALLATSPEVAAVYSDGYLINADGEKTRRFSDKYLKPLSSNTHRELLLGNWVPALGVLYKKEVLTKLGGFDESLKVEDYDFLLRLTDSYKIISIPEKLFLYRWHENNYSNSQAEMSEQFAAIREKHLDLKKFYEFKLSFSSGQSRAFNFKELWNNRDLIFYSLVRKLQVKYALQDVSYLNFFSILLIKSFRLLKAKMRVIVLRIRGVNVGKSVKVFGQINIKGNNKNIYIGDGVVFFGDTHIVTSYRFSKNQIYIGDGSVIENNATLFSLGGVVHIESGCFVGPNTMIQANGDVSVGENTMIAANSVIYANNHIAKRNGTPFKSQGNRFVGIDIGKNCWIGAGVSILDGSSLGKDSIVAAGCVVLGAHSNGSTIVAKGVRGAATHGLP